MVVPALLTSRALILRQNLLQHLWLLAFIVIVVDCLQHGGVPLGRPLTLAAAAQARHGVTMIHMIIKLPFITVVSTSMTLFKIYLLRAMRLCIQVLDLLVEAAQRDGLVLSRLPF